MAKPGPKPKFFDTRWTLELAYVVGIFASDGNLGRGGMYLNITSKDIDLLQTILKILHKEHIKIGSKKGSYDTIVYQIQFKSAVLHSWLVSIGLTPHKSQTISQLTIPEK